MQHITPELVSREDPSSSKGSTRLIVIGVTVGAVGAVLLVAMALFVLKRRRRRHPVDMPGLTVIRPSRVSRLSLASRRVSLDQPSSSHEEGQSSCSADLKEPSYNMRRGRDSLRTALRRSDGGWEFVDSPPSTIESSHGLDNVPCTPPLPSLPKVARASLSRSLHTMGTISERTSPTHSAIELPLLSSSTTSLPKGGKTHKRTKSQQKKTEAVSPPPPYLGMDMGAA